MNKCVYIAHCIDTEGPFKETLVDSFKRLKEIAGVDLEPTQSNLEKIQRKELDLSGKEELAFKLLSPNKLNNLEDWGQLNAMLNEITSKEYRMRYPDSFGGGWVFNWFLVDHVEYGENPRGRDIGYHNVFNVYEQLGKEQNHPDGLELHYHPMPFDKKAHHSGSNLFSTTNTLFQSISRRIIDKNWFPSAYRPGFHISRPDTHFFLEQYVPFDYASQSKKNDVSAVHDSGGGSGIDWMRSPLNWQPYHPDHDDHQIEGNSRRWIFRCLNVGTRFRELDQEDVDQAFEEANQNKPVVLSFTHHDYRDMRPDIDDVIQKLQRAKEKFPEVKFKYCKAKEAAQQCLQLSESSTLKITTKKAGKLITFEANQKIFGPQPFFCFKTKSERYCHDNLAIHEPFLKWSYYFDENNMQLEQIEKIGLGCCDSAGNPYVFHFDP